MPNLTSRLMISALALAALNITRASASIGNECLELQTAVQALKLPVSGPQLVMLTTQYNVKLPQTNAAVGAATLANVVARLEKVSDLEVFAYTPTDAEIDRTGAAMTAAHRVCGVTHSYGSSEFFSQKAIRGLVSSQVGDGAYRFLAMLEEIHPIPREIKSWNQYLAFITQWRNTYPTEWTDLRKIAEETTLFLEGPKFAQISEDHRSAIKMIYAEDAQSTNREQRAQVKESADESRDAMVVAIRDIIRRRFSYLPERSQIYIANLFLAGTVAEAKLNSGRPLRH